MDESDLDVEEVGGYLPVVIAAILAGLGVSVVSIPLLGLGWPQALWLGVIAGVVAAIAAVIGSRHATSV